MESNNNIQLNAMGLDGTNCTFNQNNQHIEHVKNKTQNIKCPSNKTAASLTMTTHKTTQCIYMVSITAERKRSINT